MKCTVNPELCIGCGTCPAVAPNSFAMNDETNKAEAINPSGDTDETVKMAVDSCPTGAISIEKE